MALGVPLGSEHYLTDFLVIGGGVAGLSAVNRLADLGASPVLIEGGGYPAHKVCGEFFSYECHPILEKWDVLPKTLIRTITYQAGEREYSFELPEASRGMSRYLFDRMLWERAKAKGVQSLTQTQVLQIEYHPEKKQKYSVFLSDNSVWRVKHLFIAAGRAFGLLSGRKPPTMKYKGYKAHFEVDSKPEEIRMYLFPGGYFGVSPIEGNRVNVAGLIRINQPFPIPSLCTGKIVFENWMETEVPEFSLSGNISHRYENLYLIGDAAASIAPASGDGLAMGITSGYAAADFSVKSDWLSYQTHWKNTYTKRLIAARAIHSLMQRPLFGKSALSLCAATPPFFRFLFHATR